MLRYDGCKMLWDCVVQEWWLECIVSSIVNMMGEILTSIGP